MYAYSSITWETEAGGSPQIHNEILSQKKQKKKKEEKINQFSKRNQL
jgi:hypothetical protein